VSNPLGGVTRYEFAEAAGSPVLRQRTTPATAATPGGTQAMLHDASGFLSAQDDESGMRTCWLRDELGRETLRVEGLLAGTDCATVTTDAANWPAGATGVMTEWHPDWKLPVRRAEPGQLTVDTYHGQPDRVRGGVANCAAGIGLLPGGRAPALLCFRDVVRTADASGGLGLIGATPAFPPVPQGAWTYDARGQVLTAFDASAGGMTRFSYFTDSTSEHAAGDLHAVTNAAGHVTTFVRYNGSGQWLERHDPNGLQTRRWFDARQRMVALDEGGRMTSFGYDARGALAELHEVDGTTQYRYDPTGRLTGIVTPRGDRIEYGLDLAGNRIHESLYDYTGVLRRRVMRTFDVQGRLVQQTGREIGR
jgi:YD repeat-containing protein